MLSGDGVQWLFRNFGVLSGDDVYRYSKKF